MTKLRVDMLNVTNILCTVTVIFFTLELPVYKVDEFTEHVNTVPFNVLFTDCSVRLFVVDTGTAAAAAAVLVHIMVESSRPGTVQVIV